MSTRRGRSATLTDIMGPLAPLVALVERVELRSRGYRNHGDLAMDHPFRSALAAPVPGVVFARMWRLRAGCSRSFRFVGGLSGAAGFAHRRGSRADSLACTPKPMLSPRLFWLLNAG